MNKLLQIKSISGIEAFSSLSWTGQEAARYNLIYGWNASGKTTLTRVLSFFEHGSVHIDGFEGIQCRLKTDDGTVSEKELGSGRLDIRVFNEDFIETNLRFRESVANPIIILGQASVKVEEEIEELEEEIREDREKLDSVKNQLKSIPNTNKMLTDAARAVANEFANTPLASNRYQARRYRRTQVQNLIDEETITQDNVQSLILKDKTEISSLRDRIAEQRSEVSFEAPDLSELEDLFSEGNELLQRSVEVETLERLEEDNEVRSWVQEGHRLHVDRERSECLFCEKSLPPDLLERYGAFFTREVAEAERRLEQVSRQLEEIQRSIDTQLPDSSVFFADIAERYSDIRSRIGEHREVVVEACQTLRTRLDRRKGRIQVAGSEEEPVEFPAAAVSCASSGFQDVKKLCSEQTSRLTDDSNGIEEAGRRLELHTVASLLEMKDYFQHKEVSDSLEKRRAEISEKIREKEKAVEAKHAALRDTAIAVGEINDLVAGFLGPGEIELTVADSDDQSGYQVTSRGEPTRYLSEGEKSIVALAYFLVKLNEEGSDPENTIIVIDDPVDSQDTNFLFRTYGLLRRQLQNVGQLLLLTHNYELFNLVRDWLTIERFQDFSQLYWIELRRDEEAREVKITDLPALLRHYKTEYQYLFARLYAHRENEQLPSPLVPNVARKVLEHFAAFKWACKTKEQFASIVNTRFLKDDDRDKKGVGTAVVKFLHEYSHGQDFGRPVTAAVIEADDLCENVLEFIRLADPVHYSALERQIRRLE